MSTNASKLSLLAPNVNTSGTVEATTLDGLDSSQFLRSDTSDLTTSSDAAYTTSVINTRGDATGHGLYVQTRWNVADNYVARFTSNSGNNEMLAIKGNGNVGIATTSPEAKLHINGTAGDNAELLRITSDGDVPDGGYHWMSSAMAGSQSTNANIIHLFGVAENTRNSGYVGFHYASAGSTDNYLKFGGYAADDLMVIKMNNDVGIGTTSPTKRLDIRGGDVTIYGGVDGYNADQEKVRLWIGNNNANLGAMYNYGLYFDPGNGAGDAMMIRQSTGNVGIGTITPQAKLHVVGDFGQSVSSTTYPCAIRKVWQGNFTNSTTIDLFTLNSAELPFAGTIYIHAYKGSEGVSGVWTAACIYPTVTPVVNQQSYVTRSDEYITPSWSVTNYSPTFRITMGNFSGDTYYTILVDGIVQQNFGTYEGAL